MLKRHYSDCTSKQLGLFDKEQAQIPEGGEFHTEGAAILKP